MATRPPKATAAAQTLAPATAATRRVLLGIVTGVVVIVALIVGLASLTAYQSREYHREMAMVATKNLSRLLEQHLSAIMDKTNITLQSLTLDLQHLDFWSKLNSAEITAHLAKEQALTPQIDSLRIADAEGWVRLGPGIMPSVAVNVADRDYFIRLRDDPGAGLVASGPVFSRIDKKWIMILARRLERNNGGFDGIIYASLCVQSLQTLFAEMEIGANGAIALRTAALDHVARYPDLGRTGNSISEQLRALITAAPQSGSYHAARAADGIERTVAYRRIADYPFYIIVGQATQDYLAAWRIETIRIAEMAAIAILLSVFGGWLLLRSWRRQNAATLAIARESHRNQMLLRTASDGIYVVDINGRVIEVNDAFCHLLGYTRAELLQMNASQWNAHWSEAKTREVMARIFASQSGMFETRHCCRDGRVLSVEINATAVESEGSKVLYASVRDISWRKQAEYALRDSERQLRRVFEGSDQGFWEWNLLTNAFSVSARFETMLGYAPGEMDLTVDNWPRYVEPGDFARAQASIDRHLSGESPAHEMEMRMRAASGEWHWVLTRGRVVKWTDDDRPLIMAGTHTDIAERKRSEAALLEAMAEAARANHAKSRFLAAASHDLRQPLAALSLYVGALKAKIPFESRDLMASIQECVDSLSALLTDLLDVSKLDAGVVVAKPAHFAIDEMLAGLVAVHSGEARLKGLQLRLRRASAIAHTDPILLRRIVGNLIANAVRYTQEGGVLVATRRRGGKLWIEVWDSGIGIPVEQREFVFEEFSQLGDPARTCGSGLGLAIVAKTAKLLEIEVQLRSWPGRGSVFAVEVPVGEAPAAATIETPVKASARLRIGLVEDHPDVLRALVMVLEMAGHEVVAASNGRDVLARLGERRPDILISDYRLGGNENGFDVIAGVRRVFGDEVPALLVTGDTDPALIRSMADRGIAVRYKPLQIDTLFAFINETLKR